MEIVDKKSKEFSTKDAFYTAGAAAATESLLHNDE